VGYFDRLENYLRRSVRGQEWLALTVSAAFFFCLLAAYYIIRPVREQFSAAVGSIGLPVFYMATFVVTLLLTPVFGVLVARYRRGQFVPAVYAFFALCLIAFIPLFQLEAQIGVKVLGAIFFVWVSVFNLFVVALFWSLMADIFAPEQARRLFPLIAVGGAGGAIAGPGLTKALVFVVGVPGLMVISALLLGLCIGAIYWLLGWSRRNPVAGEPDRDARVIGGSMLAGMIATLRTPFLRNVALLMLLGDCVGTVVYAFLADYNGATFKSPAERINFSSSVDLATNLLQILFQLFLTRELMIRLGPISAIVLDGCIKAVMLLGVALIGGWWIIVVAVVTRASAYGIFKPAADSLYTEVDAETRYKGKSFIDTTVWRFGDVLVSNTLNLLRTLGLAAPGLAMLTATAGLASAWVGRRIGRRLSPKTPETPPA
jgi:ATP:ADP antiporter, AAA family